MAARRGGRRWAWRAATFGALGLGLWGFVGTQAAAHWNQRARTETWIHDGEPVGRLLGQAFADEGMWTVHDFPSAAVKSRYGADIGPEWLGQGVTLEPGAQAGTWVLRASRLQTPTEVPAPFGGNDYCRLWSVDDAVWFIQRAAAGTL